MGPQPALSLLLLTLLWRGTNQVSLRVDPDQGQFFAGETVSFSCEDSSGDWAVRRNISRDTRIQCGEDRWGNWANSLCQIKTLYIVDTGTYWCESKEGQTSDAVNISVKETTGVVLQVPVFPVTEGQTVSLSCRRHTSSNLPARFHRDGVKVWEEPTGHTTLQQVSASDEGLYQCEIRGETSESSWIRVRPAGNPITSPAPGQSWSRSTSDSGPRSDNRESWFGFGPSLRWILSAVALLCAVVCLVSVGVFVKKNKRQTSPNNDAEPVYYSIREDACDQPRRTTEDDHVVYSLLSMP